MATRNWTVGVDTNSEWYCECRKACPGCGEVTDRFFSFADHPHKWMENKFCRYCGTRMTWAKLTAPVSPEDTVTLNTKETHGRQ